jgi:hypothetical protein
VSGDRSSALRKRALRRLSHEHYPAYSALHEQVLSETPGLTRYQARRGFVSAGSRACVVRAAGWRVLARHPGRRGAWFPRAGVRAFSGTRRVAGMPPQSASRPWPGKELW